MLFDRIYNTFGKKKNKEPERNPYVLSDYVILANNIEHQKIGGKKAYIDRAVTLDDVIYKLGEHNIAAINFAGRRKDLFKVKNISRYIYGDRFNNYIIDAMLNNEYDKYVYPKAKKLEYYYVKIWQSDGRNGTYLGYFVCSDEFEKIMKGEK